MTVRTILVEIDALLPVSERVSEAIRRFVRKFREQPTECIVHSDPYNSGITEVDGVLVKYDTEMSDPECIFVSSIVTDQNQGEDQLYIESAGLSVYRRLVHSLN